MYPTPRTVTTISGCSGSRSIFERTESRRYLQQLQNDRLVRAKHIAGCNSETKLVAYLASSTGSSGIMGAGAIPPDKSDFDIVNQRRFSTIE